MNNINLNCFDLEDLKNEMEKNNIDDLSQIDNAANQPICNSGSFFMLPNSTGEVIFCQEVYSNVTKKIHEKKIKYDNQCEFSEYVEPYFNYNNEKYYLNEFIRNNYGVGIR